MDDEYAYEEDFPSTLLAQNRHLWGYITHTT
jgi:hypothetical protein